MTSLTQKLSDIAGAAFAVEGLDPAFGRVIVSDRPDLAQFQCNGAMAAAKAAKKNPQEVAQKIVERLSALPPSIPPAGGGEAEGRGGEKSADIKALSPMGRRLGERETTTFSKLDIAGPGFINLNVTDEFLAAHIKEISAQEKLGIGDIGQNETVVLDYGGANIAKAMHVGHLRAAIIGDSVRRIMGYAGYKTLGDVHMGDWGTHMGMLIDDYIRNDETHVVMDADLDDPASVQSLMDDMAVRYPRASAASKEDEALKARAQDATVKIQNKEEPHYAIWKKIRNVSVLDLKRNYGNLGVHFDLWKGEADVHDYIAPMVEDMRGRGFAVESDGAWIIPVAREDDKKEVPPLILYKRDGAVMYGTTDLATIVERVKLYNPAKIIYIVDQRQSLHFEQVFRAAHLTKMVRDNVELTHAGFGTMNGSDGKPFKTRAGGVMRLDDLVTMAIEKAKARMEEAHIAEDFGEAEKNDVAYKVAIAAIKFADLQNQRHADYIFDLDRLTSFEGKTGPYLLYQAVRIKSLLKKADYRMHGLSDEQIIRSSDHPIIHESDRPLALVLTEFPDAVEAALKSYAPHSLCEYAYRLAQAFSSFYGNCHILSEEKEALKQSRLFLCALTYRTLESALNLLGIEVPERM
jgi:arginyl-tRNA synthetase